MAVALPARRAHPMPYGAAVEPGGVRFRLWAPAAQRVELELDGRLVALQPDATGWVEHVAGVPAGTPYRYRIDGTLWVPDPASRQQADDVHGPSLVVDPGAYAWSVPWEGLPWERHVFYELHVGTFSPEGTFAAIEPRLDELADLGVTAIELMPVADFPGRWGWGYDGALLYAPDTRYGSPDDLKRLVEACHARGIAIYLDVVYNHLGPEGNYLGAYAPSFFDVDLRTPWGTGLFFDNPDPQHAAAVRGFFIENARYWMAEYDFDGLRLDAVQVLRDRSERHFLRELAEHVAELPGRARHLVLENGDNAASLLERAPSGEPRWYVAQWNDDVHHALHVALTGERGGYYAAYAEPIAALARCLAEGFAFQGEPFPGWIDADRAGARRGEPSGHLPPTAFVGFLQNHDQVGNRALGARLHTLVDAEPLRAATAIALLAPHVPLLFMGQEWAASTPFLFFSDLGGELGALVTEGRRREFVRFDGFTAEVPDPQAAETVAASRLRWEERSHPRHARWLDLHRSLLAIRRREVVPHVASGRPETQVDIPGARTVRAAWRFADGVTLTMAANLSDDPAPLALLDVPGRVIHAGGGPSGEWSVAFSVSESVAG